MQYDGEIERAEIRAQIQNDNSMYKQMCSESTFTQALKGRSGVMTSTSMLIIELLMLLTLTPKNITTY